MKNAIVAAVVAALVASTGTYAATGLISGAQIKNHTIASKKLTRSAIRQLRGQRGPRGLQGPAGLAGPAGPAGPQGPAGLIDLSKLTRVDSGQANVASGTTSGVTAACPSGAKAVGGGFIIVHGNDDLVDAYGSAPTSDLSGWSTIVANGSAASATVEAYAVCVSP